MALALECAARAVGADGAARLKRAPHGWDVVQSHGLPKSLAGGPLGDADAVVAPIVAEHKAPVLVNDPAHDSRVHGRASPRR